MDYSRSHRVILWIGAKGDRSIAYTALISVMSFSVKKAVVRELCIFVFRG